MHIAKLSSSILLEATRAVGWITKERPADDHHADVLRIIRHAAIAPA